MIYLVTGWSYVPGDQAYIEADDGSAAIDMLFIELGDADRPSLSEWSAVEVPRPLCIIQYKE